MIVYHSETWAAVTAREDVDGSCQTVVYQPDRGVDNDTLIEIEMTPSDARRLARALNKAARRLSS